VSKNRSLCRRLKRARRRRERRRSLTKKLRQKFAVYGGDTLVGSYPRRSEFWGKPFESPFLSNAVHQAPLTMGQKRRKTLYRAVRCLTFLTRYRKLTYRFGGTIGLRKKGLAHSGHFADASFLIKGEKNSSSSEGDHRAGGHMSSVLRENERLGSHNDDL